MKYLLILIIFFNYVLYTFTQVILPPCNTTNTIFHDSIIHIPTVIPFVLFVDSDGDGIPDDIEGTLDCDNDSIPNYLDTDSDADGLLDSFEGASDPDNDNIKNFCDLDSDGDGVPDEIDACYGEYGVPPNGCSIVHDYRKVFWVHGYQGTSESLILPGNDVGEFTTNQTGEIVPLGRYKVLSYFPDYNISQQSLLASSLNLRNDIGTWTFNQTLTDNNFIIAHSLGGLVSRKMGDLYNPVNGRVYNGIVTFGTPHLGAYAANTLVENPWKISNAVTHLCESIGAGPLEEAISNSGVLGKLAVSLGFIGGVVNTTCDQAVLGVFPSVLKYAEGVESELTTSNASSIPSMPTQHRAAFYGIETDTDESMTARFIGAVKYSPNSFPRYGADESDDKGLADVLAENDKYVAKYNYWLNQHAPWWLWLSCAPCAIYDEERYDNLEEAYKKGVDWFPILNPTWKSLIGVGTVNVVQTGCLCAFYEEGTLDHYESYSGNPLDCSSFEQEGIFRIECSATYDIISENKDSDGFILSESAVNAPGLDYDPQLMIGTNHLQMRNNKEMEKAINKIFGDGLGGAYFKTNVR